MIYKGKTVHKTVKMQTDSYTNKETERRTDKERAKQWDGTREGMNSLSIKQLKT